LPFPYGSINLFQGSHALGIELNELRPLARDACFREDGLNRAFRNARVAVNAVFRVDVKLVVVLVKAIARANDHAVRILAVPTGLTNDKSHDSNSFTDIKTGEIVFSFANLVPTQELMQLAIQSANLP